MATSSLKTERFEFRATSEQKAFLEKATAATGLAKSDFILQAAMSHAHEVLEKYTELTVADERFDYFLNALENPAAPNAKLKAAYEFARESGIE